MLTWVTNSPHKYSDFIANRVTVIQDKTAGCIWRHVPGKFNPVDVLSRVTSPAMLIKLKTWFNGSGYLYKPKQEWTFPKSQPFNDQDERLEVKSNHYSLYAKINIDLVRGYKFYGSPGRDGRTRVVEVVAPPKGDKERRFIRAVTELVPIPTQENQPSSN